MLEGRTPTQPLHLDGLPRPLAPPPTQGVRPAGASACRSLWGRSGPTGGSPACAQSSASVSCPGRGQDRTRLSSLEGQNPARGFLPPPGGRAALGRALEAFAAGGALCRALFCKAPRASPPTRPSPSGHTSQGYLIATSRLGYRGRAAVPLATRTKATRLSDLVKTSPGWTHPLPAAHHCACFYDAKGDHSCSG